MSTLTRPISPPPRKRPRATSEDLSLPAKKSTVPKAEQTPTDSQSSNEIRIIRSPIRLYSIKDLPPSENIDTATLKDVLSPSSTLDELWSFNFMTHMPWLKDHFQSNDQNRIKIRIVHGYWRQEDESRKFMEQGIWGENVKLISAYLPDPYGTHHSKIIVLFRTDDTAQVIVQTANMIPFDHENMTNAFYITDPLPLKQDGTPTTSFELALLDYFAFYGPSRTRDLTSKLDKYDFTSVKAEFIASVPGKFEGQNFNRWGLGRLRKLLKDIETHANTEVFAQFSSIGSFGKNDTWIGPHFHKTLAMSKSLHPQPQLRLVYPTLKNVQESLNGYRSGTSIHWTITSPAHEAQETYMRPLLRQWHSIKAGRERAAPHIKTYGRLTKDNTLDWFLMTSANLSKAAWGGQEGKTPNIGLRIRSYEAGVLLDPALYGDGTVLVPTFRSDLPSDEQVRWAKEKGYKTIVAVRMAWDIPFKKYDAGDVPWVKNRSYEGTDWLGMAWVA